MASDQIHGQLWVPELGYYVQTIDTQESILSLRLACAGYSPEQAAEYVNSIAQSESKCNTDKLTV